VFLQEQEEREREREKRWNPTNQKGLWSTVM
jgi:hypothetical protein